MYWNSPWTSPARINGKRGNRDADCPGRPAAQAHAPLAAGAVHVHGPAAAERSVPVGMAAGTAGGVPLPGRVRQVGAAASVRLGAVGCRTRGARTSIWRSPRSGCCRGRQSSTPWISSTKLAMFTRETAARRRAAVRQHQDLRGAARRVNGAGRRFRRAFGTACSPSRGPIRPGSVFSGQARTQPPDIEDYGQCSSDQGDGHPRTQADGGRTIHPGPDPGQTASFVTPNINEKCDPAALGRAKAPLAYAIKPIRLASAAPFTCSFSTHRFSRIHSRCGTTAHVPFLLGESQAVQYSLKPCSRARDHGFLPPGRELSAGRHDQDPGGGTVDVRFHGAGTDRSLPDADRGFHGQWPEDRSPYVPVARLRPARSSASTPPSSSRSRTSCVIQPLAPAPGTQAAGKLQPGLRSRCTGSWRGCARP